MLPDILIWITYGLGTPDHPKALSPTTVRTQYARLATHRYGDKGWGCLDTLIRRESGWRLEAANPTSTARGLWQLLRLPKGLDSVEQWVRGTRYLDARYDGAPCAALKHHNRRGWY